MKKLLIVLGALLTFGCASFAGPPAPRAPAWRKSTTTPDGTTLEVIVEIGSEKTGRCENRVYGIQCEFGELWLYDQARFDGGWGMLDRTSASRICYESMWPLTRFTWDGQLIRATQGEIDACAWELVALRFREMAPDPRPPEYQ